MGKRKALARGLKALIEQEPRIRLAGAEAQVRALTRKTERLRRACYEAMDFNDDVLAAVQQLRPIAPVRISTPRKSSRVALVACVGDWHTGERINEEDMDGFNRFDWAVEQERVHTYVEKLLTWLKIQKAGYHIERIYVPVLGDLIQGEVHEEEYLPTNEFRVPEQIALAAHLLAWFVQQLAPCAPEVVVDFLGVDNHARRTRRPANKDAARNSHNYSIWQLFKTELAAHERINIRFHRPLKAQVEMQGRSVLLSHGHEQRSWMGVPYYGIERSEGREARKRLRAGRPYFLHLMGHWHVGTHFPGIVVNGAVCGSSEYDAAAGRHADPSQTSFLLHKRHGEFNIIHWKLDEPMACAWRGRRDKTCVPVRTNGRPG